jgi:Tfp pilus assembly protein PilN
MCRDRAVRAAAAAATLLLVLPLPLEMYLDRRTARHEHALPLVEREAKRLSEARVRLRELGAERIRLSSAIDELARLEGGSYAWVRLMDATASALAEPCWLQGLTLEGSTGEGARTARIQGIAPSLEHVTRFERALRATGTIRGLTLSSSEGVEIAGHPLVRFSLVGEIAAEPRVSRTAVSR